MANNLGCLRVSIFFLFYNLFFMPLFDTPKGTFLFHPLVVFYAIEMYKIVEFVFWLTCSINNEMLFEELWILLYSINNEFHIWLTGCVKICSLSTNIEYQD